MNSIYWHDYETFGADPRRDRPSQFAGIRTDEDLNIISDPLMIYCRPADDYLPDPGACVVTGLSPQIALEKGLSESEFCAKIYNEFIQPGTCVAGYNSIRFDDEVTRHMLYRCFYDAYEREWKYGNSRWDIIDLVRMAHAVRPDGINWPKREDGLTSFRLEELTKFNGIGHEDAHDALSDVIATIDMAKLIKQQQPRLYDYLYKHRGKKSLLSMLNPDKREPIVHVSGMFGAERGCVAVVIPLLQDPTNSNGFIAYDLSQDPDSWSGLNADEIRERLYTPRAELPEGLERVALKTIHANKCPALAPLSVLDDETLKRWNIDLALCKNNLGKLESIKNLELTLAEVFRKPEYSEETDPDFMLYSGSFFDHHDKNTMAEIHGLLPSELSSFKPPFHDQRLPELLFRYRARNWPETLNDEETSLWQEFCLQRFTEPESKMLNWENFWQVLNQTKAEHPDKLQLLEEVAAYAKSIGQKVGLSEVVT